jgi:hypothetical protein
MRDGQLLGTAPIGARGHGRLCHVLVTCSLGLVVLVGIPGVVAAAGAQEPAPGPAPSEPAPSEAPAPAEAPAGEVVPSTQAPALGERVQESEDATRRLNIVVLSLLGLAGAILVATVLFWRATRPDRVGPAPAPAMHWVGADTGVDPDLDPAPRRSGWTVDPGPAYADAPAAPSVGAAAPPVGGLPVVDLPPGDEVAPVVRRRRGSRPPGPDVVVPSVGGGNRSAPVDADPPVAG